MATIFKLNKETCSFCGEKRATGYWGGQQHVSCCPNCAVEVLPRLLADSLIMANFTPGRDEDAFRRLPQTILKNFWHSVALACLRVWRYQKESGC